MLVSILTPDITDVMDSIQIPDSNDDGRKPKVKIPPPVFKGLPGERPDAHLLATADWMEAMRLKPTILLIILSTPYSIWLVNGTMAWT